MGQFLRDQFVRNVDIDESALKNINDILGDATTTINAGENDPSKRGILFYVIRFDEKGYRFTNFSDVMKHYADARQVERVIFTVDSAPNRQSAGLTGVNADLRLEPADPNICRLMITADNQAWVDSTFCAISELLNQQKNSSWLVRTQWTGLLVQIFGVLLGFLLSLWAAVNIAPYLSIDNAFVVALFFTLLIYSNIWTYINTQIGRLINYTFPNVRFKRKGKDTIHWVIQAVIATILGACVLFLLGKLSELVGKLLSTFLIK